MMKRFAVIAIKATLPWGGARLLEPGDGQGAAILILSMGGFGNTLMATPLMAETRRLFPRARIDLVTTPGAADLLAGTPHVNTIYRLPERGFRAMLDVARVLRRMRYTHALAALNTVAFRNAACVALSGAPWRAIHAYPFKPEDDFLSLFTHRVAKRAGVHDAEGNLDLLRALTSAEIEPRAMELTLAPGAMESVRAELAKAGWQQGGQHLAVAPGCRAWARDKRWPLARYAQVILSLLERHADLRVFAFCGPEEREELEYLGAHVQHERFRLIVGLNLVEYPAALKACGAVLSNDSLPVHICSALQIPVVALFGPTDPKVVGPWRCPSRVVQARCEYAPYFTTPYSPDMARDDPCMTLISVEEVRDAVEEMLRKAGG